MTNELSPKSASALLRNTFASKGVKVTHTEALDLLAKLKGFEAWSHMSAALKASKPKKEKKTKEPRSIDLRDLLIEHYGHWGDCPAYPRSDWQYQVENGDTTAGYFDWLVSEIAGHEEYEVSYAYSIENSASVTLPNGEAAQWNIEVNLTDRWGDLNYHAEVNKPGLAILALDAPLLEKLQASMTDEITFVVRKDNEFGLLFEVEYASYESEAPHDVNAHNFMPHDKLKALLLSGLTKLQAQYPKVQFCVPDECNVVNDRPAVWGFFKVEDITKSERIALSDALSNLA